VLIRRNWPRIAVAFAATAAALLSATRAPRVAAETTVRPAAPGSAPLRPADPEPVHVRILGINDLHGHLDPTSVGGRQAGGVAWLSSWLDRYSADGTPTIRVSAGDAVGASPLISAHFRDEPTVEALNAMHFDVATVGNHDFDEGRDEMLRLASGGDGSPGAAFPYIGANTLDAATGKPFLPPYEVLERGGVKIGFIGVTTPASGRWLLPRYADQLRFADISDTVNRYADELEAQGVHAIVVLAHSGGAQETGDQARGEIVDEARQMTDAVDVVIAGHTHTLMDLRVGHKIVTQAISYGTAFDDVDLQIDPRSDEVVASQAQVVQTWHDGVTPDPALTALVDRWRARLGGLGDRHVADLAAPITRIGGAGGQSPLGTLVAESERAAAHADIAFVPPDWIRADLPAGPVTYSDVFDVQPFGNDIVRMDMKGSDLREVLAEQEAPGHPILQQSGLPSTIDIGKTYSVAASEFLADGGEDFAPFRRGTDRSTAGKDVDALADYLARREAAFARSR
jgi:5'-nucleotidase